MNFSTQKSTQQSGPVDMTPTAFKNMQTPLAARLSQLLGFSPQQFASFGGGGAGTGGASQGGTATKQPNPATTDYSKIFQNYQPGGTVQAGNGSAYEMMPDGTGFVLRSSQGAATGNGGNVNRGLPLDLSGAGGGSNTGGGGSSTDLASLFTKDPLSGIPQYSGPLTAGMTASEQQLLRDIMGASQGATSASGGNSFAERALQDIINQQGPNVNRPEGTLADFADMLRGASNTGAFSGAEGNPFMDAYIKAAQRPTLEGLTETLTRDLPGRFTQAGQFIQPGSSSAFDRAAAIASRGASNANADIATKISYQALADAQNREGGALNSELDRRFQGTEGNANRSLEAAKSLPGVTAQQVNTLISSLQAEGLPRLIQQQGIDKGMELFKDRVDNLMKVLGLTAGVTQPTISQQSSGSSSGTGFGLTKS